MNILLFSICLLSSLFFLVLFIFLLRLRKTQNIYGILLTGLCFFWLFFQAFLLLNLGDPQASEAFYAAKMCVIACIPGLWLLTILKYTNSSISKFYFIFLGFLTVFFVVLILSNPLHFFMWHNQPLSENTEIDLINPASVSGPGYWLLLLYLNASVCLSLFLIFETPNSRIPHAITRPLILFIGLLPLFWGLLELSNYQGPLVRRLKTTFLAATAVFAFLLALIHLIKEASWNRKPPKDKE